MGLLYFSHIGDVWIFGLGAGGLQGGLKLCAGYGRPQAVSTQSKPTGEARGGGSAAGPAARPAPFARYLFPRSASNAVTNGRWALRSHICKSGASAARQRAAVRPGRLYISRRAGFANSSPSVSSSAV